MPPDVSGGEQPLESQGLAGGRVRDDAEQCAEAVAPTDLLAVGVRAAGVADPDLVDREVEPGDLGGHLGFDAET